MITTNKFHPYMREHSNIIRLMRPDSYFLIDEDMPSLLHEGAARAVLVVACRNRQRLIQLAWTRWTNATNIIHDYKSDTIMILSKVLRSDEYRSELEIEVMFKWVLQTYSGDPTGIAYSLKLCSNKTAVVNALQSARLERYDAKCAILIQNEMPLHDDGHFTIMSGSCDIVHFKPDSGHLFNIHLARKAKNFEFVNNLLVNGSVLNTLSYPSGFGELSALTKVNRNACVRASDKDDSVSLLVIPRTELLECLHHRNLYDTTTQHSVPAEVMDYLRQSGLVRQASMVDFLNIARSMSKKTYKRGTILFQKGDVADKLYLIVSGEVFLDTSECQSTAYLAKDSLAHNSNVEMPFQHLDADRCYCLGSGSMLGDEGLCGEQKIFAASGVITSEIAVFFEVTGLGYEFLSARIGYEKYAAIGYMNESLDEGPLQSAANVFVIHSTFSSLRQEIAANHPYRGCILTSKSNDIPRIPSPVKPKPKLDPIEHQRFPPRTPNHAHYDPSHALYMNKKIHFTAQTVKDAAIASLRTDVIAMVDATHNVLERDAETGKIILPAAALYHIHSVTKIVKKRSVQALRNAAQEHVLSVKRSLDNKGKEYLNGTGAIPLPDSPVKGNDKETGRSKSPNQRKKKHGASMNSKVERAVNQYTNRLAQSSENKKISSFKEIEFTSNFQDTQTSQSPLETAVLSAFNKKLVKNVGILALKESEWTPDLNAKLTKLEEYYQIMRKKSENALKKPIVSRLESVELFGRSKSKFVPGGETKSKDVRPSTIYTVGIDFSTHPNIIKLRYQILKLRAPSDIDLSLSDDLSLSQSDKSFGDGSIMSNDALFIEHLKSRKFLTVTDEERAMYYKTSESRYMKRMDSSKSESMRNEVKKLIRQSSIKAIQEEFKAALVSGSFNFDTSTEEAINDIAADAISENLDIQCAVKSEENSDTSPIGRIIDNELEESTSAIGGIVSPTSDKNSNDLVSSNSSTQIQDIQTFSHESSGLLDREYNILQNDINPMRLILLSRQRSNDAINNSSIFEQFETLLAVENTSCKYIAGRKKQSSKSRYALKTEEEVKILPTKNNGYHSPTSYKLAKQSQLLFGNSGPSKEEKDLEKWKTHCLHTSLHTKNSPARSLPVLSTTGSHRFYWEKRIVTS